MSRLEDLLLEVKGLNKGMGQVGKAISKAAGGANIDVSADTKPVAPKKPAKAPPEATEEPSKEPEPESGGEVPPEDEIAPEEIPEEPEQASIPRPEKLKKDDMGNPDKEHLKGHTVRFDGGEYKLAWDNVNQVYMLVDPSTKVVRTRVRPEHVSTIDYKESLEEAVSLACKDVPVGLLIEELLESDHGDVVLL